MRARLEQLGAGCFVLWGLVHVVGGASLLATLRSDGAAALLRAFATAEPGSVPDAVPAVAGAVAGFHAWNLLWIGALVVIVALRVRRRDPETALWLNLALAGFADVGLVFALLLPGHMPWIEGSPGLVLFALAAGFSLAGRR